MEPGLLVWFPDAAANATWLILLQLEPFYGTCGNLACALSIYQYADFFDLPIGFPDVPCGAFRMELSQLEKETLSDLGYQNLYTWSNAMPASGL